MIVWDSHPLRLGATPTHVFIDGISQIANATGNLKASSFQTIPDRPNFASEISDALKYDGLPPLESRAARNVLFTNVAEAWSRNGSDIVLLASSVSEHNSGLFSVYVKDGIISCLAQSCDNQMTPDAEVVDLHGGALSPALTSYGSPLGLDEIEQEPSTKDGPVNDPLVGDMPKLLWEQKTSVKAVDGLNFGGRDLLCAHTTTVPVLSADASQAVLQKWHHSCDNHAIA